MDIRPLPEYINLPYNPGEVMKLRSDITQWNPFNDLENLQNRGSLSFPRFSGDRGWPTFKNMESEWTPAVDVDEDDEEYTITADLPDVKKDDVKVTVDDGMLTIRGERHQEKEETKKKHHRIERSYGKYTRSFELPKEVDSKHIDAQFEAGVLKVHLPKLAETIEKQQEVPIK